MRDRLDKERPIRYKEDMNENDEAQGYGFMLEIALSARMKEAADYASRHGLTLDVALAQLINKGLSHLDRA